MDKTTRDIFALINAYNALLETLYAQVYKDNPEGLRTLEDMLTTRLRQPPRHPNPADLQEAIEIQPQTLNAVWAFFRGVESKIQEGLTE